MIRTIGLVQVNDTIGSNVILPLAIGILWQYAQQDHEIRSRWQLGPIVWKPESDESVQKLSECDLICFSNYVWNTQYHTDLARKIKGVNPNVFIVMGGPNISQMHSDFWLRNAEHVDLAIVGEGEQAFLDLLKNWPDLSNIPGTWTSNHFAGIAPRVDNFPYHASPYLNGFYDSIVEIEQSQGNQIQAVIQTNRGCPYHCTFCEEGSDYKNKLYQYDEQRIRDEIEWCAKNKIEYLSLADDNWGISARDVELMRWIRDCKLQYGYPQVLDATYAKNAPDRVLEIAKIDAEFQTQLIRGITVALQSGNPQTLNSIRRFNLIETKQIKLIQELKGLEIPTYTEMIWPLPFETLDTFYQGLDLSIQYGLDNWLGVYPLSLHAGTQLHEDFVNDYEFVVQQSENNLRPDRKETVNIVNQNRWVTKKDIIEGQVFYAWLVSMFYFGFARTYIQAQTSPVTHTVKKLLQQVRSKPNCKLAKFDLLLEQWWSCWLAGKSTPNLSIFPDDTTHWSPYTHLASWIQQNLDCFYEDLEIEPESNFVRFDRIYNDRPRFDNLFEFSRYYYWWKRKQGLHRLTDKSTSCTIYKINKEL